MMEIFFFNFGLTAKETPVIVRLIKDNYFGIQRSFFSTCRKYEIYIVIFRAHHQRLTKGLHHPVNSSLVVFIFMLTKVSNTLFIVQQLQSRSKQLLKKKTMSEKSLISSIFLVYIQRLLFVKPCEFFQFSQRTILGLN